MNAVKIVVQQLENVEEVKEKVSNPLGVSGMFEEWSIKTKNLKELDSQKLSKIEENVEKNVKKNIGNEDDDDDDDEESEPETIKEEKTKFFHLSVCSKSELSIQPIIPKAPISQFDLKDFILTNAVNAQTCVMKQNKELIPFSVAPRGKALVDLTKDYFEKKNAF